MAQERGFCSQAHDFLPFFAVTGGLLGLHHRLHYGAQRPIMDSVDFHAGYPSLPGSIHDSSAVHPTACKPAQEGGKPADAKSSTVAASLPPKQTNLRLDQMSPPYAAVTFEITAETQTRSIFSTFAAIRSSSCQ